MTLCVEIRFLTGRYVATTFNDRQSAEWPPHPARVYSALTAALYDGDGNSDEREALQWLEAQAPPVVHASRPNRASVHTVFVPVNDETTLGSRLDGDLLKLEEAEAAARAVSQGDPKAKKKAQTNLSKARKKVLSTSEQTAADDGKSNNTAISTARRLLPGNRGRQGRTFPSIVPAEPVAVLEWATSPEPRLLQALDAVCERIARIGHSSSLTAVRVQTTETTFDGSGLQTYRPADDGPIILRITEAGQLERLDALHTKHSQAAPRTLPSRFQRYTTAAVSPVSKTAGTVFTGGAWTQWRVVEPAGGGKRNLLRLSMAEPVARALKGALLHHAADPPPPLLSGHVERDAPMQSPHAAFLPLADVGHEWATASILGVALQLPRDVDPADLRAVARAVGTIESRGGLKLRLGRAGVVHLERIVDDEARSTFAQPTWCGPSRRWATATPIALGRNPGNLRSRDPDVVEQAISRAEQSVRSNCLQVGLPAPDAVLIRKHSSIEGAPPAEEFMPFPRRRGHGFKRVCVHAEIVFPYEVSGPVLLGAGRYVGLGLCRPIREVR